MAQYSRKRGAKTENPRNSRNKKMSMEEKRRQWNVDLANRTLETMFGSIPMDDDGNVIISDGKRRKVTYTAETLYEKAMEYFMDIAEKNSNNVTVIPDIEDFCMFAHIPRSRFLAYRKSDDVELADVADNIATAIASCKKQNAYAGLIATIPFAMDMNNNHDYVQQRTETTVHSNISLQQVDANVEDIASRIPMEDIPSLELKFKEEK